MQWAYNNAKCIMNIYGSYYYYHYHVAVVVQLPSRVRLFVTPWIAACQASLSLTIPQSLSKFMFIASVIPSSHLILWCPLLLYPASALVLLVNIQGWAPLRFAGLISFLAKGLSRVFFSTTVWRHQFFGVLPALRSSSHNCTWPLGRP